MDTAAAGFFYILVIIAVYLIPCFLAIGKRNGLAIILLNLFLGWTFLACIACFIWACVSPREVGNEN